MMLINSFIFLLGLFLALAEKETTKSNVKAPLSLLNIPENLPVEELQEGLRVLSTSELKTLSEFIDDRSKMQDEHYQYKRQTENGEAPQNMLGALENYWTRHVRAAATAAKKKRNIGDLDDEMAHENAESPINNERNDDDVSEMEALGCTCRSLPKDLDTANMRTKRDNQYAENLEKGYSAEEYIRDLENSFPHGSDEKEYFEGETVPKSHLRIKRLQNSKL